MSPQFTDARHLLSVAAARAACAGGGGDLVTSWYVAQVGLGVSARRLAGLIRVPKSRLAATVRAIEERRECGTYDAALSRIERRAARWLA